MKRPTNELFLSLNRTALCAVALAFCVSAMPALARQGQSNSSAPAGEQSAPQPAEQAPPPGAPPAGAAAALPAPQAAPQASRAPMPPPATLTLQAGTIMPVRVNQWLSSDRNHPGDTFSATLDQPLIADGWVVARRGQSIEGRVDIAQKAGHGKKDSQLGLELGVIILVDGQQLPMKTELVQTANGTRPSSGRDAATIGTTAIIGAAIGGIAGGGTGAAIGAGLGATAGAAGVVETRGKPTIISPETLLTFRLDAPLAISTERSQVAFRPVTQSDYNRDQDAYAPYGRRFVEAGPGYGPYSPYAYPYVYGYPGWGYYYPYPSLYLGFYGGGFYGGGYGFGPRFGIGRGFRR